MPATHGSAVELAVVKMAVLSTCFLLPSLLLLSSVLFGDEDTICPIARVNARYRQEGSRNVRTQDLKLSIVVLTLFGLGTFVHRREEDVADDCEAFLCCVM